jgi:hypothetical protein
MRENQKPSMKTITKSSMLGKTQIYETSKRKGEIKTT